MSPSHLTFQPGDLLRAADVNDALNPTTAAHVPWAVAAGIIHPAQGATGPWIKKIIDFPAGRFTQPPRLTATWNGGGASGAGKIMLALSGITATRAELWFWPVIGQTINASDWLGADWIAIQMDA